MVICNLEFFSDFVRKIVPNLHIQHGCSGAGTERQQEQKRTNCSSHKNAATKCVLNLKLKTLYIVSCSDGIRTSRNAAKCVVPEVTDMILNTKRAVHQIQREEFAHETFCFSEMEIWANNRIISSQNIEHRRQKRLGTERIVSTVTLWTLCCGFYRCDLGSNTTKCLSCRCISVWYRAIQHLISLQYNNYEPIVCDWSTWL